jgi:VanZ family protein
VKVNRSAPHLVRAAQVFSLVYAIILVVLAVIPRVEGPGFGVSDWILHSAAYGIFGGLVVVSVRDNFKGFGGIVVAWVSAVGFGLGTELLQLLVPYRSFEFRDVVADGIGALIVIGLVATGRWFQGLRTGMA